jgi:hypothetical protein
VLAGRLTSSVSVARLPLLTRSLVIRSCADAMLESCGRASGERGSEDLIGTLEFIERCFKPWAGDGDDLSRQVDRIVSMIETESIADGQAKERLAARLVSIVRSAAPSHRRG